MVLILIAAIVDAKTFPVVAMRAGDLRFDEEVFGACGAGAGLDGTLAVIKGSRSDYMCLNSDYMRGRMPRRNPHVVLNTRFDSGECSEI